MAKIAEKYEKAGVACGEGCTVCNETKDERYEFETGSQPAKLENFMVGLLVTAVGFITGLNIGLWYVSNYLF